MLGRPHATRASQGRVVSGLARSSSLDRGWESLRLAGGIVLAVGMALIRLRMSDEWDSFPLFLVLAVPFLILYGLALTGSRASEGLQAWQSAFLATAVLLMPLMLERLAAVFGVEDPFTKSGTMFWVLAVTAAAAVFGARGLGSSINVLLGALAAGVAALFLVDWIGSDPGVSTFRNTLAVVAATFALLTFWLRRQTEESGYLACAAGIAAVGAGAIGSIGSLLASIPFLSIGEARPSNGWEAFLLASSLALIAYTTARRYRATGYIAAIGLLFFIVIVGQESEGAGFFGLVRQHTVAGWPIALAIVGLLALAASLAGPRIGGAAARRENVDDRAAATQTRISPP